MVSWEKVVEIDGEEFTRAVEAASVSVINIVFGRREDRFVGVVQIDGPTGNLVDTARFDDVPYDPASGLTPHAQLIAWIAGNHTRFHGLTWNDETLGDDGG